MPAAESDSSIEFTLEEEMRFSVENRNKPFIKNIMTKNEYHFNTYE
jgi:hypothetical protein